MAYHDLHTIQDDECNFLVTLNDNNQLKIVKFDKTKQPNGEPMVEGGAYFQNEIVTIDLNQIK